MSVSTKENPLANILQLRFPQKEAFKATEGFLAGTTAAAFRELLGGLRAVKRRAHGTSARGLVGVHVDTNTTGQTFSPAAVFGDVDRVTGTDGTAVATVFSGDPLERSLALQRSTLDLGASTTGGLERDWRVVVKQSRGGDGHKHEAQLHFD